MEGRELPVDVVNRKRLGIKIVADPIPQLLMLIVVGVTDSIQKIVKSPDAPTIFRWAGELAASAHRIRRVRISSHALLKDNAVLPGIAKIIRVYGLCADPGKYAGEPHRALVFHRGHPHEPVFRVGSPEVPAAHAEFMHVAVLPSHGGLQRSEEDTSELQS